MEAHAIAMPDQSPGGSEELREAEAEDYGEKD
jgi:hypothetical protein